MQNQLLVDVSLFRDSRTIVQTAAGCQDKDVVAEDNDLVSTLLMESNQVPRARATKTLESPKLRT